MNFSEYQDKVVSLILPTAHNEAYLIPGIAGEVGELCSLYAKRVRDGKSDNFYTNVKKELGDILWFVTALASYAGWELEDIANTNIEKLESRKARGVLGGSGDNR